jgi:GNAT superfamily N-acetyltransferase
MSITYGWREDFENFEINGLHAEAFETGDLDVRDWQAALTEQSLGWVTARDGGHLVGFVNVVWDGLVHAWIQDTMVANACRSQGIGTQLVAVAKEHATDSGCKWLHVDFDESLGDFYLGACNFAPTTAGLMPLE